MDVARDNYYVILYDHDGRKQLSISEYPSSEFETAMRQCAEAESKHWGTRIEAVLLGAASEDALRLTHPNYFREGYPPIDDYLQPLRDYYFVAD
ncbi:hypothetical protein [Candidatus Poriferisodalis sp.]|uniref:hypothetical protein n=1 Tax=Candidatus Poriferisodalis sp. TaxID=3101277 RepID=UPI003B51AB2C